MSPPDRRHDAAVAPRRHDRRSAILALPRLVAVWLRVAPSAGLILVTVVALSSFLATAAPLWFVKATDAALPALMSTVSSGQRGLEFEQSNRIEPGVDDPLSGIAAAGDKIRAELPGSLERIVARRIDVIDSQELVATAPPQSVTRLTFRIEPAIADAIRYYAGRAPTGHVGTLGGPDQGQPTFAQPLYEVALSRTTASMLLVGVGDRLSLVPGSNKVGFAAAEIVGLFDELDPSDPIWFGDTTLDVPDVQRVSSELFVYHAIGLLSPDAYPHLYGEPPASALRYRWRFSLDLGGTAAAGIDRLTTDLAKLRAAYPFGASGLIGATGLSTGLTDLVDLYRSRRAVAGTALALALVGAIVAGIGALGLVAATLARRRAGTVRLARARGAGRGRLLAIQIVEAVALVVPATAVGAVVASLLVVGRWDPVRAAGAAVVGLIAIALLVGTGLGATRSSLASGRQRTERTAIARNRRRVLDALVVIVAVATAISLRSGGSPDPADPYRAVAPAVLAVAGAIVIIRGFDAVVAGLGRLGRRGRGFVGVHAVRGLARGPRTHELPLLVLLVAVAAGVFSATVATTIDRTQALAAATSVGADYRIESVHGGPLPTSLDMAALAAVGTTAVAARDIGTLLGIGLVGHPVDVVGLDARAYGAVVAGGPLAPAFPAAFIDAGAADGSSLRPLPIVVPASLASDTGLATGSIVRLAMGAHEASAVVVGVGDPVPAIGLGRGIVAPLGALRAAFPDRTLLPAEAFVRGSASTKAAIEAVLLPYRAGLLLVSSAEVESSLRKAPLVDTMTGAFFVAQIVAAIYSAVVVAAAVSQALAMRSAELSLLRALGVPARRVVGIVVVELGSTVLVALVGGLVLGLATTWLVVPVLGIERFVGVAAAASPAADAPGLAAAVLAPAVACLLALVLFGRAMGSSDIAEWIRSAET